MIAGVGGECGEARGAMRLRSRTLAGTGMVAFSSRLVISLLGLGLLSAGAGWTQEPFPHDRHARLFPLCEGCHRVEPGEPGALYPEPTQCGACHDGEQVAEVQWSPPSREASYRHPSHEAATGVSLDCRDCHGGGGSVATVDVSASCSSCHEEHHSAAARCTICHTGTVKSDHGLDAHRGCGGAECHTASWASQLTFNRSLCLLCHQDMKDHKAGRDCGRCHAVGQPAR